jgi:cytoskeleton protein RodZ
MKYNYLQQIESSASFLNTEIFRLYYSRIPKEVDMNATSTHGSQFYINNQPDTDNHHKAPEPASIPKPLHLVESVNENPQDNDNRPPSLENLNSEQVDTMLTSRLENNRYFTEDQEVNQAIEPNDVTSSNPKVGESVNLSPPQSTDNQAISSSILATVVAGIPDSDQSVSTTATLARSGEIQPPEEAVATWSTPMEVNNDKAVEPLGVNDNQINLKLDSPQATADIVGGTTAVESVETEAEPIEVKLDYSAKVAEEQRQTESEVLSEDTFSLFNKLATPEPEIRLKNKETSSSTAVPEEPQSQESLDIATMKAGAYLRSEREKSRLSVQQVADKLYLDANLIKNLEADDYERLPPRIFVRGYIRNYAKLLEVPAEPLLVAYEQSGQEPMATPSINPQLAPQKQTSSSDWRFKVVTYTIIIALMMLMVLWQYYPTTISEPQGVANVPDGPAWENFQPLETPPTYPAATVTTNPASSNVPQPSDETSTAVVATTTPEEMTEIPAETTEPTATTTDLPTTTAEPLTQDLKIHFKQNVWIRLTDSNGKVFYNQTGKGGEVFSIQDGVPPFYLNVGNQGLQIEYQGKTTHISDYPRKKGKRNTFVIGSKE